MPVKVMPSGGPLPITVTLSWYKVSDGSDAADLSASQKTFVIVRPDGKRYLSVNLGWTAPLGEEPVGTLAATILGHPKATDGADYPQAMLSPAGSADGQIFVIDTYGAPAVVLVFTRTSGGGGALWKGADGTGAATATWMEG